MQIRRGERGFTLFEVMVVMAITAIIMPSLFTTLDQLGRGLSRNSAELTALNQVRQADNWITEDASQAISFNDELDTFGWPDGTSIHYYLTGDGDLLREVDGSNSILIASNISEFDLSLEGEPIIW